MDEIKIGDIVRLKSGSPLMTVDSIEEHGHNTSVAKANCVWFEGTNQKKALFALTSLELEEVKKSFFN